MNRLSARSKDKIVNGTLPEGEMLPSIRGLAADLKISVITVKRAYEDLEKEGMIYSVQGKGFYVDNPDLAYLKEKKRHLDWRNSFQIGYPEQRNQV